MKHAGGASLVPYDSSSIAHPLLWCSTSSVPSHAGYMSTWRSTVTSRRSKRSKLKVHVWLKMQVDEAPPKSQRSEGIANLANPPIIASNGRIGERRQATWPNR